MSGALVAFYGGVAATVAITRAVLGVWRLDQQGRLHVRR